MKWQGLDGKPLPEAGDAFLVPLGKRLFTFCWIVGFAQKGQRWHTRAKRSFEVDHLTLVCADWFGTQPPEDLARPEVLRPKRPDSIYRAVVTLISEPPPKKFRSIGKVGRASVGKLPSRGHAGWPLMESEARAEWAWRKNPQLYAAQIAAREQKRLAAQRPRKPPTSAQRIAELRGMIPKRRAVELTRMLQKTARALPQATGRKAKLALLERLVVEINAWNRRVGPGVIDTAERELLCVIIDALGRGAGLRGGNFAEALRDW